eukprot:Sdes_comp15952_c0_seq1m5102
MLIKEFRIPLNMTVEEYQVAQLYSVAQASKNETGGGEGVEVIKNEPFENEKYGKGQYTYKIYHLQSKVPKMIRLIAPKGALEIHEEAWNAYPYCRTVLTNPGYMKENFQIVVTTWHKPDAGHEYNVHNLDEDQLKKREVVMIDIANDALDKKDYNASEDPKLYKSEKTSRGLLEGQWQEKVTPMMTCYKLVECEFKWFGLQGKVENFIIKQERRIFLKFHRQLFCWTDSWYGKTMDDIRELEAKTKAELDATRNVGQVRGTEVDD